MGPVKMDVSDTRTRSRGTPVSPGDVGLAGPDKDVFTVGVVVVLPALGVRRGLVGGRPLALSGLFSSEPSDKDMTARSGDQPAF